MTLKMVGPLLFFWHMPESKKGRVGLMWNLSIVMLIKWHLLFFFVTNAGSYPPSVSESTRKIIVVPLPKNLTRVHFLGLLSFYSPPALAWFCVTCCFVLCHLLGMVSLSLFCWAMWFYGFGLLFCIILWLWFSGGALYRFHLLPFTSFSSSIASAF